MRLITKWVSGNRHLATCPILFVLAVSLAMISGCNTSGSSAAAGNGDVVIGLTDAEGDFLTYAVDVVSIKLTKANGAVVETLPLSTRVDFAQYVELTEFVTAATIPAGLYTHATLTLDYSNADIQVDVAGVPTAVDLRDGDGNPVTQLEAKVRLDDRRALLIVPGVPAHLTLDFDLAASHRVDTATVPPLVTVAPFLLADVDPDKPKLHRARGPLISLDEVRESFTIGMRPFHHPMHGRGVDFGHMHVATKLSTVYEIDGQTAEGSAGFALLAQKSLLTAVVVVGDLNMSKRVFEAREVYAGSSVPGGTLDAVRGHVTARNGDTVTVRGATLMRADGTVVFNADVDVLLGLNTKVVRQAQGANPPSFTKDDISVGQKVIAFGSLSGSPPGPLTLDATQGWVRMLMTTITGTVTSTAVPGQLVLNLQHIGARRVTLFDFAGTGSDPANYTVDTGTLPLAGVNAGDPVRIKGFVTAFGMAPPDFSARTVINLAAVKAFMAVDWVPPTATPFTSLTNSALVLDLAGAGPVHHVYRAGVATVLNSAPPPQVVPDSARRGLYGIRQNRTTTMHTQFSSFVSDLSARLGGSAAMKRLLAKGSYDDVMQIMTAHQVRVVLQ